MGSTDIAIVGGGISGCSAAWFLREALGGELELTVYERDAQLGGRLATIDVGGTPVEAGGTIIHETNRYLAGFVEQLGLQPLKEGSWVDRGDWGAETLSEVSPGTPLFPLTP